MVGRNDLRTGMIIKYKDDLYVITECEHRKPGKGQAFTRCKLKNIRDGTMIEDTWKPSDKIEDVKVVKKKMLFLYSDELMLTFMDQENYQQYVYSKKEAGDLINYLVENTVVEVKLHENRIIGIELPYFVNLKVVKSAPGAKGNTVTNATKKVELQTGLELEVPLFIKENEVVKVDTRTGEYIERVKT